MSRSRRFSGNLIVQPEVVEQRLRTGVASVYCPAWRGHIALVGETRRFRSEPVDASMSVTAMFRQQRDWAQIPRLFGLDCELLRVQTFVNCWLPRIAS